MAKLLIPVVIIMIVAAVGLGYYFMSTPPASYTKVRYEETTQDTVKKGMDALTKEPSTGAPTGSAIRATTPLLPTVTGMPTTIDTGADLDAALDSINLDDLGTDDLNTLSE